MFFINTLFIALPTPSSDDGSLDLTYIKGEVEELGKELKTMDGYKTFVVKSTVIPGTTQNIVLPLLEKFSGKKAGIDFGLAMNPEFLMEGLAISNFQNPDRVVIGAIDDNSRNPDKVETKYLENAINALLKGNNPEPNFTKAIGCSIKV